MDSAPPNFSRISRLKKRFLDVLSGSIKLDPRGASLFLDGLCAQEDPVICLHAIVDSAHGFFSVQSAMQVDLSIHFMNGLGFTVLEYLLRTSDIGGDALDSLLFHVTHPPIFWDSFVCAFKRGSLNDDTQLVFARLLARLLTLQDRDTAPYRFVDSQPCIQDSFATSPKQEIREIGYLIKHILSNPDLDVSVSYILNGPGGRHDNDFADYRNISILPTVAEILCCKPPFLRPAFCDEFDTSQNLVNDHLDNTFRMLREDMLFDIREGIQAAFQKKRKSRSLDITGAWSIIGVYTGTVDRKTCWGVKLRCGIDSEELGEMKGEDTPVDSLRWGPRGAKLLKDQSLVCLLSGQDVIGFGTVNRVDELLASNPPVVVLQIDGAINIRKIITTLGTTEDTRLIQLDAPIFAFRPVLTALQKMRSIPLAEELLYWKPGVAITSIPHNGEALLHVANAVTSNLSVDFSTLLQFPTPISLDKSQAKSLIAGLTKRVSLIQGPPGTGKSFIGTILAKTIHDKTSQTILIVCYTNHALDQFLGELLKYGVPAKSIVRLGRRPSQATEHLALQNNPRARFRYDWDTINELREDGKIYKDELETHFDTIRDIDDRKSIMQFAMTDLEFSEAFFLPLETEDGMTIVGEDGKAIDERYLFSRWARGLDAGVLSGESLVRASARIWGMDHSARQQQLEKWRNELIVSAADSLYQAGDRWNTVQETIKQEFGQSTVAALRQKRIIACTTAGAAINAEAIKEAGPEVLLVEEAGEILESHILTALSPKVDRMILIGDHKQLRPKVNNYQLTVERGEGFDLNRSLFERLVLKGYPHETLSTQHRMRPEISTFVRELTYPDLADASSTYQRPDIRGVQSNVVFVDHTHPEDDESLVGDRADSGTKMSKQNTYEVQMVLKIVRYLAQQGYNGDDIVVLTPYLGQLLHLRDALKRDNDTILNDLDSSELARAGLSSQTSKNKVGRGRIHLSTIDNYQGEESRIVVASLTRSNKSNTIGFMDSPQRLNVLLSRARDGLILIGNSQTFLKSKKGGTLWKRLFALLEDGQYVRAGFPVKCERHPARMALLKHANDFDDHCPDGGCTDTCGFALACGHQCQMKCHPPPPPRGPSSALPDPHDRSHCKVKMRTPCPAGHHTMTWECHSLGPSTVCSSCVEEAKRLEGIAREFLELEQRREQAEVEHQRRMAELEAEIRVVEAAMELKEELSKRQYMARLHDKEELERQEDGMKRQGLGEQKNDTGGRTVGSEEEGHERRERERRTKEEVKRKREERRKEKAKKKKKQEEKKQRKVERRRKREENKNKKAEEEKKRVEKKKREEKKREEKRRQEEQNRKLHWQEAASQRRDEAQTIDGGREEEGFGNKEDKRQWKEPTERGLEISSEWVEEQREIWEDEDKCQREEKTKILGEATRRRLAEKRETERKKREENASRLQEAAYRRQEEMESRAHEELRRNRQEQTQRLVEATYQRQEERWKVGEAIRRRGEYTEKIQEATARRRQDEEETKRQEIMRQQQTEWLRAATRRREGRH